MEKKWVFVVGVVVIFLLVVFLFQGERVVEGMIVVVFYNFVGIGVVEKMLIFELNEGLNNVFLKELEGFNVVEVMIMFFEGVEVFGIFSRGINEDVYSVNVGMDVEVKLDIGEIIQGKFYGFKDGKLVVEGEDYYLIDLVKVVYFKVLIFDELSVYVVFCVEKKGEYNVILIYCVEGMNWKSRYKFYIGERVKFQGYVVIINLMVVGFESVDVFFVVGDVQFYQILLGLRVVYFFDEKVFQVIVGEFQKFEVFYVYVFGMVNINLLSMMVYFYVLMEVLFQREYFYESWVVDGEWLVYELIFFKMDKVFLVGIVEVYCESEGRVLLIGEMSIEYMLRDDVVRIGIGRDYDLKGRMIVLDVQWSDDRMYYKIKIEVENFGNDMKIVIIRYYKSGNFLSLSVEFIDEIVSYVEFSFIVNFGEKKEVVFEYSYK